MATYTSSDIRCPFYEWDDPRSCHITCEGALPGSSVKSHFPGKRAMQEQIRKYCAGQFQICPWFRVLWIKYDIWK